VASEETTSQLFLYPNPAGDKLFVQLPFSVNQLQTTTITDARGVARLVNAHTLVGENQLEIPVESLPKGVYLLQIQGQQESQLVKFVKHL
jgi:hypothetical protein